MHGKTIILGIVFLVLVVVGSAFSTWLEKKNKHGLEYVAIGIDENRSPIILGVKVRNETNSTITVVDCYADVTWNYLLSGAFTPENMPPRFEYELSFLDKCSIDVPANSTVVVNMQFHWKLDKSAPPSVAACQVIPVLQTKDNMIPAEHVTFVVTNKGSDDSVQKAGGFQIDATQDGAKKFLQSISALNGKKSPRVQRLIDGMRERIVETPEEMIPVF